MKSKTLNTAITIICFLSITACNSPQEKDFKNTPEAIAWLQYHNNKIPDKCINYYLENYVGTTSRTESSIKEASEIAIQKASLYNELVMVGIDTISSQQKVYDTIKEGVEKGYETPNSRKSEFLKLVDVKQEVAGYLYKTEYDVNGCDFEKPLEMKGIKMPDRRASMEDYYLEFPDY